MRDFFVVFCLRLHFRAEKAKEKPSACGSHRYTAFVDVERVFVPIISKSVFSAMHICVCVCVCVCLNGRLLPVGHMLPPNVATTFATPLYLFHSSGVYTPFCLCGRDPLTRVLKRKHRAQRKLFEPARVLLSRCLHLHLWRLYEKKRVTTLS